MSVFVTGGTGVVGSAVVRHLVEAGRSVTALSRSPGAATKLADLGAVPVEGDVERPAGLPDAMKGCEVVYHIAGRVEFCSKNRRRTYEVNVDGTRNVIRAARQAGVRRLVYTSSVVTLGESPGGTGSETTVHRGRFYTHYERSKFEAEAVAFAEAGDVEVVAVNPSSVQGPGRSSGTARILLNALNGRLPVMIDTPISIVDVDDCARGHLLAQEHGVGGERYVLSGFTISTRDAIGLLSELTGRPSRVRLVPTRLLAPMGPVADLLGRFVTSVPVCAESIRQMRAGARYDGSKATRDLGLHYRTPRETFSRLLDWFRSEGLTDA